MVLEAGSPPSGRRVVFVYYKVARTRVEALKSAFSGAGVPSFAFHVQLLRGANDPDVSAAGSEEPQTWMEIYWLRQHAADLADRWAVEAVRREIEAWALVAGLVGLIHGQRHYEAFEACA